MEGLQDRTSLRWSTLKMKHPQDRAPQDTVSYVERNSHPKEQSSTREKAMSLKHWKCTPARQEEQS